MCDMVLQCGGAAQPSRWCAVLKATVQVNVMSRQDVASEVPYFTRVCPSPTDVTSALVITAVASVSLCCVQKTSSGGAPKRLCLHVYAFKHRCQHSQIIIFL